MAKGILKGIVVGGLAAAVGYVGYKRLSVEQRARLDQSVDQATDTLHDRVVDAQYAMNDAVALVREKADEALTKLQLDDRVSRLVDEVTRTSQDVQQRAGDLLHEVKAKTTDFREDAVLAKDEAQADILIKEADLADTIEHGLQAQSETKVAHLVDDQDAMLKQAAAKQVASLAASGKTGLAASDQAGLAASDQIGLSEK